MGKYFSDTRGAIETYFRVQAGCINQKHPGFVQNRNGILEGNLKLTDADRKKSSGFLDMFKGGESKGGSAEGNKDVLVMKNLLIAYNNV